VRLLILLGFSDSKQGKHHQLDIGENRFEQS